MMDATVEFCRQVGGDDSKFHVVWSTFLLTYFCLTSQLTENTVYMLKKKKW